MIAVVGTLGGVALTLAKLGRSDPAEAKQTNLRIQAGNSAPAHFSEIVNPHAGGSLVVLQGSSNTVTLAPPTPQTVIVTSAPPQVFMSTLVPQIVVTQVTISATNLFTPANLNKKRVTCA